MTVFNMIHMFLEDEHLTVLHFNNEVVRDIPRFLDTLDSIKRIYGDNWPYMKIICPDDQQIAVNQYPRLAIAAKAWVLANAATISTLKNIVGMKLVSINWVKQAKTRIPA